MHRSNPESVRAWLSGRVPEAWFTQVPAVEADDEEILITGHLAEPELPKAAKAGDRASANSGRITRFREDTREQRMTIAAEAEQHFGRKVSWGAACGDERELFTTLSVPVMTRLRMPERTVLDTLVDSGAARSRSDALAWCVKLVASNQEEWFKKLRGAFAEVEKVRSEGPKA